MIWKWIFHTHRCSNCHHPLCLSKHLIDHFIIAREKERVTERKLLSLVWAPNYFIAPTHEQTVYFWNLTACSLNSYWTSGMGTDNQPKDQREIEIKLVFSSASTAKAFYFQFLVPGVCFFCFCFLGLTTCCHKDSGLMETTRNLTSGSWYSLWERPTRCHWQQGLCNQAHRKSSRFSFSLNPSVLLYNFDPSFAFPSKLAYCTMCVSVYVYTLPQTTRHTIISCDWVASLQALKKCFKQMGYKLMYFWILLNWRIVEIQWYTKMTNNNNNNDKAVIAIVFFFCTIGNIF